MMADDQTIQDLIDDADPEETIVLPWRDTPYELAGVIEVSQGLTFDFNGNTILFKWQSGDGDNGVEKGFKVLATTGAEKIIFKNGIMKGYGFGDGQWYNFYWRNHKGPVITSGSSSSLKIELFQIENMVFKDLTFGCNFNCTNGGYIRNAVLLSNVFDNIVQIPPDENPGSNPDNDPDRGKGAAFSFNTDKSVVMSGFSSGNVFRDCERHSLYVSQGGPFLSVGDSFFNNCKDLEPNSPIGAIALSRNSHMRVSNAYFSDCRHGIVLSLDDPGDEKVDVEILDSTFINSKVADLILNSFGPDDTGVFGKVLVSGTKHLNSSPYVAISVRAFREMILRDIDIVLDAGTGTLGSVNSLIWVFGYGSCDPYVTNTLSPFYCQTGQNPQDDTLKNNNLMIDNVTARFLPNVPATARVIALDPTVFETEVHSPHVALRRITTNGTPLSLLQRGTSGTTMTNPNVKWSWL